MVMATEALITDTQRFSVDDGPGIRTTVFFKGCPLACRWCHNPETIAFSNEPVYSRAACIGCGDCVAACPDQALALGDGGVIIDARRCTACLTCTELCPGEACAPAARPTTPRELLREVLADRDYYGEDGGVTLSGGEPLVQVSFLSAFLPLARAAGLHLAAQTCGHWSFEQVEPLLRRIDLLLFDLKAIDPERHRQLTGRSNKLLLENLKRVTTSTLDLQLEVRVPLVGGCNVDQPHLEQTARLLASLQIGSVTLLPYHRLGEGKGDRLRGPAAKRRRLDDGMHPPTECQVETAVQIFDSLGITGHLG